MTRTALYRHYDADGQLLYVGITDCPSQRDREHACRSHWHDQVARTETQWVSSREYAADLERAAIFHEAPIYNVYNRRPDTRAKASRLDTLDLFDKHYEALSRIDAYAEKTGQRPETVCRNATGNPRLFERLSRRLEMLDRDFSRIEEYMRENAPSSDAPRSEAS